MLTINNISKSFFHRIILENLSFKVKHGDTIALLGKNGIGKSTLLRILGKISQPDVGDILYKNSSIYKEKASVRKGMLYLGHDVGLYPSLSLIVLQTSGVFMPLSSSSLTKKGFLMVVFIFAISLT